MNTPARLLAALALLSLAPACGGTSSSPDAGSGGGGGTGGGTGGGAGGGAGNLPGSVDIDVATMWAATPAPCDVVVTRELYVNAPLTVAPGTQVCFQPNTGLIVQDYGLVTAVGTAEEPIVFTGTVAAAGSWKGISLVSLSGTGVNRFAHATFQHAGNPTSLCCANFIDSEDIRGALLVGDKVADTRASVEDCTFKDVGGHGVFVFTAARLTGFARNTFQNVAQAPVAVPLESAGALDAATVYSGPV
ncbi:MAG: hypothetical protein FJ086_18110, partial [Deltaproteobacteria bacterium]|nr:hypothetical protein [Deltaproteobacteria bacterium]